MNTAPDLEKKVWKLAYFGYAPAVLLGEGAQIATRMGRVDYNFFTGHISDFALAGYFTAFAIAFTERKSRTAQFAGATLPAVLLTLREYFPLVPIESVVDHWDVACYVAAAAITTAVLKYTQSD